MKTIVIDVTQEDIDSGVPTAAFECPVAIAAARAFGFDNYNTVSVVPAERDVENPQRPGDISVIGDLNKREYWNIPAEASKFVHAFDDGNPVKPFSFKAVLREKK